MFGLIAYLLGFAEIAKGSLAAWLMSLSWSSGIGMGIISALQSSAATFAHSWALLSWL